MDMLILICFRNVCKLNKVNSKVNEIDMYDLLIVKLGKNYLY